MMTPPLSATLVSLDDAPNIRVDTSILLVGRSSDCDVVVDSKKVSRRHCCIALVRNYLLVRDLGSTNGVRLNNQRLDEIKLFEGDELTIANQRYRLQWDQPQEGQPHFVITDSLIERCNQPVPLDENGEVVLAQTPGTKPETASAVEPDAGSNNQRQSNPAATPIDPEATGFLSMASIPRPQAPPVLSSAAPEATMNLDDEIITPPSESRGDATS